MGELINEKPIALSNQLIRQFKDLEFLVTSCEDILYSSVHIVL